MPTAHIPALRGIELCQITHSWTSSVDGKCERVWLYAQSPPAVHFHGCVFVGSIGGRTVEMNKIDELSSQSAAAAAPSKSIFSLLNDKDTNPQRQTLISCSQFIPFRGRSPFVPL